METYSPVHNKIKKGRDRCGFEQSVQLVEEPGLSQGRDLAALTGRAVRSRDAAQTEQETGLPIQEGLLPLVLSIGGVKRGRVS